MVKNNFIGPLPGGSRSINNGDVLTITLGSYVPCLSRKSVLLEFYQAMAEFLIIEVWQTNFSG